MEISSSITLPSQDPVRIDVKYVDMFPEESDKTNDSHVHPECEIYINLSGDVSFMVEKHIYPISYGSIVVTRPYEYHHCVYHSDEHHKHFWILFSLPTENSEIKNSLLGKFFSRRLGMNNLLKLQKNNEDELISLCHKLAGGNISAAEKYSGFYRLLDLIDKAFVASEKKSNHPAEIDTALSFIDRNYQNSITIKDIADHAGVSVNTLERHFRKSLSISPNNYLKKKRLARAAELLFRGKTVSEACEESGFSDYSHFIALFKSSYGTTPLKYKKDIKERRI
jgi:AraC-like DNA-binding protein